MEVMSQLTTSSPLNPNAPLFVPMAYRTVEDYSEQWFALVQTSPWFRDYWLRERFQDPQLVPDLDDDPLLPDIDALFENFSAKEEEEENQNQNQNQNQCSDLVSMAVLRWRRGRGVEAPRYVEKAPKRVSVRVSPRTIQQPR